MYFLFGTTRHVEAQKNPMLKKIIRKYLTARREALWFTPPVYKGVVGFIYSADLSFNIIIIHLVHLAVCVFVLVLHANTYACGTICS